MHRFRHPIPGQAFLLNAPSVVFQQVEQGVFNATNPAHGRLAGLGRACAERVAAYVAKRHLATEDYKVGRERVAIRHLLTTELAEIDALLAGLIG